VLYINPDEFIGVIASAAFRCGIKFAPETRLQAGWLNASKRINVDNREEE